MADADATESLVSSECSDDDGGLQFMDQVELMPKDPVERCFSWRTFMAYCGPGWLMSLAYLDPGNLEGDLQSGAFAGYSLLWVLLVCALAGLSLQILAARLAVVTGRDLAQTCRAEYPRPLSLLLWLMTELAIIGADIQEVVGTGIALKVLLGWPLWLGSLFTGLDTFTFLMIHYMGKRWLEAFILLLIFITTICFFMNFAYMPPSAAGLLGGFSFQVPDYAVVQMVGTIGGGIMPHNLYLHSGICKQRACDRSDDEHVRQGVKYTAVDAAIALLLSFLINAALVSTFATGFFSETCAELEGGPLACLPGASGEANEVGVAPVACVTGTGSAGQCGDIGLAQAGDTLKQLFGGYGRSGRVMFAVGLLAAGQASTMTGTMAGQYVLEGFLEWHIPVWLRALLTRLISLGPAVAVAVYTSTEPNLNNKLDQWINVLESMQIPFALLPVLHFNSKEELMGKFVLSNRFQLLCWALAIIIIVVNIKLVAQFAASDHAWVRVAVAIFFVVYATLITLTIWSDLVHAAKSTIHCLTRCFPRSTTGS
ncbi:unnamed protein product [Durusdinium trenchii]|uniref:Uncharacterized protein n=1 Tax=Durusdinium trenchii TaxID=1381693 RepID=A0ABP0KDH7_9DINO